MIRIIQLIVDSGMDQNKWFEEKYKVGFLPLTLILDEKAYLDKKEISQNELHTALRAGKMAFYFTTFARRSQRAIGRLP